MSCITDIPSAQSNSGSVSIVSLNGANEPAFRTIALENKLFDAKTIKENSARAANKRRLDLLRNQRTQADISPLFTAQGQFLPDSTNVNRMDASLHSFDNSGFGTIQGTRRPDMNVIDSAFTAATSQTPTTKFHDQNSLLAMVSDQISKLQQSDFPGNSGFSNQADFSRFPTSKMPFTGPASAWDIKPKLPTNVDLKIPPTPTQASVTGKVDLPPPPIDTRQESQLGPWMDSTWQQSQENIRSQVRQQTINPSILPYDPITGRNIFTATSPPPVDRSFNTFPSASTVTTVPPPTVRRIDLAVQEQNMLNTGLTTAGPVTVPSFLFDPISPTQTPPTPLDTGLPPIFPDATFNLPTNSFEPSVDLTNTFDQPPKINREIPVRSNFIQSVIKPDLSPTPGLDSTTMPPSSIKTTTKHSSISGHTVQTTTPNVLEVKNSTTAPATPTIQYDMVPFQNNANWAIFDPTSTPTNFSDFGPIIELPIEGHVSFKSANEVGFQSVFSQASEPNVGTNAKAITTNADSSFTSGGQQNTDIVQNAEFSKASGATINTNTLSDAEFWNMGAVNTQTDPSNSLTATNQDATGTQTNTIPSSGSSNMLIPSLRNPSSGSDNIQTINTQVDGARTMTISQNQVGVNIPDPPPIF